MKRFLILIYKNLDPVLKQEIVYIGAGVSIGWLVGTVADKLYFERLKKRLKEEEEDISRNAIPKSRIRKLLAKLKGGELFTLINIYEIFMAAGGVGGFIAFLKQLSGNGRINLIVDATVEQARAIAVSGRNPLVVLPPDTVKDVTCVISFEMLTKLLLDSEIPFEDKRKAVENFFTNKINLKKPGKLTVFIFCTINLLLILYAVKFGSFLLVFNKLKQMYQSGQISRVIYYKILRELKKKGIPVDEDLDELVS